MKLLLSSGVEVNTTNGEGKTALELASDPEIIDTISKHEDDRLLNKDNADYFGSEDENSD